MENGVVKEGDKLNQGSAVIKERVVSVLGSNDLCYCCQCEKRIRAPFCIQKFRYFQTSKLQITPETVETVQKQRF